jgi:signal peptidase I
MQSPPLTPNSGSNTVPTERVSPQIPAARHTRLRNCLLFLAGVLVSLLFLAYLLIGPRTFDVVSASMEPTLMSHDEGVNIYSGENYHDTIHDHILVSSSAYWFQAPQFGDIILFQAPKQADFLNLIAHQPPQEALLVQRIIGLPGDTIEIRAGTAIKNGKQAPAGIVYRNGTPLEEYTDGKPPGYIKEPMYFPQPSNVKFGVDKPLKLGPEAYFVMGDNRNDSNDSRYWGTLERSRILGKVKSILSPPERRRLFP